MTENFIEIRMEICSCFVRKHKYWKNRGKNWIARITGLDQKYGYRREFLGTTRLGREKVFFLEDFCIGEIYEIASIQKNGSSLKGMRDTFVCTEISKIHVILEFLPKEEVLERFSSPVNVAVNLVQQLLKIATRDEAVKLIEEYG